MISALVLAAALAQAPAGWSGAHPAAFSSLPAWVQAHPGQARLVFWWDRQHPGRAEGFLSWIVDRPAEGLDAFAGVHPTWPAVAEVLRVDRPAMDAFVAWGRAHPRALHELAAERGGLGRLGFEQLAELWQKHPAPEPPVTP